MSSEKNLHHFCFWHSLSFDFYMVILSPGTNENFLPHRLKKIESGWPALRLIAYYFDCIHNQTTLFSRGICVVCVSVDCVVIKKVDSFLS